ncbi:UNVERIFIED_CONTAM: hypothetical protein Sangu_2006200 [Sesamum angustifolium]|uniref:Reverse transcriptase n=1 Tax=Sesamum angustifolium TaxID=2727405 RepID=A0AAW2LH56_9LAMI
MDITPPTMIFCQASSEALTVIKRIFKMYEIASGLKINWSKSALVFSKNIPPEARVVLARILEVEVRDKHDEYLGLPSIVGKSKREVFEGLNERCWNKFNGWANRKLSQAEHAVLIKIVLQAMPSYVMNCFEIPEGILRELEGMMANFF